MVKFIPEIIVGLHMTSLDAILDGNNGDSVIPEYALPMIAFHVSTRMAASARSLSITKVNSDG